jgi:hypothetical protein
MITAVRVFLDTAVAIAHMIRRHNRTILKAVIYLSSSFFKGLNKQCSFKCSSVCSSSDVSIWEDNGEVNHMNANMRSIFSVAKFHPEAIASPSNMKNIAKVSESAAE